MNSMVSASRFGIASLVLVACALFAAPAAWAASTKADAALPAPEPTLGGARFKQSAGGPLFGALVLATKNESPTEKWEEGKIGRIEEARVLALGEKARVLVMIAVGAKDGISGSQAASYAVDVYGPDGALKERFPSNACLTPEKKVEFGALVVCDAALSFEFEPSDPRGRWVFKVIMPQEGSEPLVFGTSFEAY